LSNQFWYGFAIGFGLVTFVAVVPMLIARARAKKDSSS